MYLKFNQQVHKNVENRHEHRQDKAKTDKKSGVFESQISILRRILTPYCQA